ncbi:expressed unknown protein [Seminavis robusta]|uniref:Uncharacterized protein n=1 Tax=Seminavis robusta TaxID=568900 RepID=A0A9N8ELK8_9STRA|nr:expressed unknown protein [Seminavis robusta]|eukprot:Sro1356_g265720.1 n/a (153) ;mRNA; r:23298-23848
MHSGIPDTRGNRNGVCSENPEPNDETGNRIPLNHEYWDPHRESDTTNPNGSGEEDFSYTAPDDAEIDCVSVNPEIDPDDSTSSWFEAEESDVEKGHEDGEEQEVAFVEQDDQSYSSDGDESVSIDSDQMKEEAIRSSFFWQVVPYTRRGGRK